MIWKKNRALQDYDWGMDPAQQKDYSFEVKEEKRIIAYRTWSWLDGKKKVLSPRKT